MRYLALLALIAAPALGHADEKRVGDAYSLGTCAVSGEKLGSMGEPPVKVVEGREFRLCCAGCGSKLDADRIAKVDAAMIADQQAHYPTDKCVISGAALGDSPVEFVAGNRLFKTCCNNCASKIKADPAGHIGKLDEAVKAKQGADYALETCPIGGEALGSMGEPVEIVVANRLVKLCCAGCVKGVEKDPAAVLSKVDAAKKG